MRLDALLVSFALSLFLTVDWALAAPGPRSEPSSRALHVPILRREPPKRTDAEWGIWAKQQKQFLEAKYGGPSNTKRSSGENLCARFFTSLPVCTSVAHIDLGLSIRTLTRGELTVRMYSCCHALTVAVSAATMAQ